MAYYPMSDKMNDELTKRFTYHAPKDDQNKRYAEVRRWAHEYATWLAEFCPESRELSLALTKLEECVFWANASIARNE